MNQHQSSSTIIQRHSLSLWLWVKANYHQKWISEHCNSSAVLFLLRLNRRDTVGSWQPPQDRCESPLIYNYRPLQLQPPNNSKKKVMSVQLYPLIMFNHIARHMSQCQKPAAMMNIPRCPRQVVLRVRNPPRSAVWLICWDWHPTNVMDVNYDCWVQYVNGRLFGDCLLSPFCGAVPLNPGKTLNE